MPNETYTPTLYDSNNLAVWAMVLIVIVGSIVLAHRINADRS